MAGFLPFSNPVSQWVDPRRNTLMGLSAGFLSGDPGAAMRYAMQGRGIDQEYALKAQQMAKEEAERNATMEWVKQNAPQFATLPPALAFEAAMKAKAQASGSNAPASVQEYEFARQNGFEGSFEDWRKGGNQTVRAGMGQPIPLRNRQTGEYKAAMPMSDGTYWDPLTQQPFDNGWDYDPAWMAAQRAAGTAAGTATTEAAINLPNVIAEAEKSLTNLDGLLPQFDASGAPLQGSNKGFDEQFGTIGVVPQQWLGALPGSEKAGFQKRIQQVQGESFLTAINSLRGLGALSDAEGKAATAAITRISSDLPKEEFVKAVKELQDIVRKGVDRARSRASQSPVAGQFGLGGQQPQPTTGNTTASGVSWKVK